jgi:RNA polymerase II subunit A small phosphatase-like protein
MKKPEKELLLIFDLDETLVHATKSQLNRLPDFEVGEYKIYKRPDFDTFINQCNEKYKIAVWSSADDKYVKETVKKLFPNHIKLEFVWTRLNCSIKIVRKPLIEGIEDGITYKEHQWIKPLNRIKRKGIGIKRMLIIDNSPYKVVESKENALIIPSFEGEEKDSELLRLYDFLANYDDIKDVRKVDKENWQI